MDIKKLLEEQLKKNEEYEKFLIENDSINILFNIKKKQEILSIRRIPYKLNEKSLIQNSYPKDLFKEKDNNSIFGTCLVNLLNLSSELIGVLVNFQNKVSTYEDNNILFYTFLSELCELKRAMLSILNNSSLEIVLSIIFSNFYNDLTVIDKIFGVKQLLNNKYFENYKYNFFCKNMYNYLSNFHNFANISQKELLFIFSKSLIEEITYIKKNIGTNTKIPQKYRTQKIEIKCFADLFFITMYNLNIINKPIKICKNCKKYFIPKFKKTEVYCRRKYKGKKYTCSEFGDKSYRNLNSNTKNYSQLISKEKNRINMMLKKHTSKDIEYFKEQYSKQKEKISNLPISEDEKLFMELKALKKLHQELKKNKKKA